MSISDQELKAIILDTGLIAEPELLKIIEQANKDEITLEEAVANSGLISDEHLGQTIADYKKYNYVDLKNTIIEPEVLNLISEIVARNQQAIAYEIKGDTLLVAMNDPDNLDFIHLLEKKSGKFIEANFATKQDIKRALALYRKSITEEFDDIMKENVEEAKKSAKSEDLPVIKIVDSLLAYAYQNGASDIHLEPYEEKSLVRYRIDGVLHDVIDLPKKVHDLLVTRFKIMSKLRIDEHRAAQDGKLQFITEDGRVDVRVSIVPITEGEKIVMRLLSAKNRQHRLEELGFSKPDYDRVISAIKRPHGMILATGPTGSGKTTTLYSILQILNSREVNISTIEDPVEYDMAGVNQIQVNNKTNLTFANGLRSLMRQDPDIIMVGEIRDQETANIAVNAAMTGHLVLSTLHTNDAATAMPRFLDMGIEPFLIASTVNVVIAQRLVRKNCSKCITNYSLEKTKLLASFPAEMVFKALKDKNVYHFYKSKGCKICHGSGYRGRIGVYEVLEISSKIKEMIMNRKNSDEIKEQAIKEGMITILEDGLLKAASGETSIEEVLRVSKE